MLTNYSSNLRLSSRDIWEPDNQQTKISYPEDGHNSRVALEQNSFWFNHRNNCISSVVKHYSPDGVVFDIGGGNGFVSLGLQQAGLETVLVEPGKQGASNAKNRGIKHVVCSSFQDAGFHDNTLPAIGVFDVVEHIENDLNFLTSLNKKLVPGGHLYLTVPAFQSLWSAKDVHEGHFRRYTINSISQHLQACGFEINYSSYFFAFLAMPIFLLKAIPFKLGLSNTHNTAKGQQEHAQPAKIVKTIINKLCDKELKKITNNQTIPFGSSIIVVAKKVARKT